MVDVTITCKKKKEPTVAEVVSILEDIVLDGIVTEDSLNAHEIKSVRNNRDKVATLILYRQPAPDGGVELVRAVEAKWSSRAPYQSITVTRSTETDEV